MHKIKRVSYFFRVFFQVIFIGWPIIFIFAWMTSPDSIVLFGGTINMSFIPREYLTNTSHPGLAHVLSNMEKFLGFGLSSIPMIIELFIIYSIIKLFKLYEKGEIFSLNNVNYIRNIGIALLADQVVNPLYELLMGFVLTWRNPPGQRYAGITLDQTNIGIVFMAILVILISWIMAQACELREEQQLTI